MPGKRITDHQVHKYKQHRNQLSQVASAAKAGISERSARRIEQALSLPSQRPQRNWRTRQEPPADRWAGNEDYRILETSDQLQEVLESGWCWQADTGRDAGAIELFDCLQGLDGAKE